jgi:hypothetical protein
MTPETPMPRSHHPPRLEDRVLTRRELLHRCGMGMGALGLVNVCAQAGLLGTADAASLNPLAARAPHFAPKAKRVLHLFMNGGPSALDTFDPKPLLAKYDGKPLPNGNPKTERKTGNAFPSPFAFAKHGASGLEVSELFPALARHADKLCVIRSMYADVPNHEPSLMLMNTGEARQVRPSLGAWTTYGLGSENQNLPGFVVLCPGGYPVQESQNWQAGFLPGAYQGTFIDTKHEHVDQLIANVRNRHLALDPQRRQLDLLQALNREHQARRRADAQLEARVHSFELAYRMQMEATDAFDVDREPAAVRARYGDGAQGRQLLMARRLLERGVRFVQVWTGAGQPWDNHDDLVDGHKRLCGESDRPIAALLEDLAASGLLDETLVVWGGEFGRTPVVELPTPGQNQGKVNGRDHNHYGFTMWLAGGGARPGYVHGATDDLGWRAVEKRMHVHDLHATILHLLGFDHERFTFRHAGRDFRLTDVHGTVAKEIVGA